MLQGLAAKQGAIAMAFFVTLLRVTDDAGKKIANNLLVAVVPVDEFCECERKLQGLIVTKAAEITRSQEKKSKLLPKRMQIGDKTHTS